MNDWKKKFDEEFRHSQFVNYSKIKSFIETLLREQREEIDKKAKDYSDWATSDDTGISSEALLRHMLGLNPNHKYGRFAPSDKWDRGRCIRLLNRFPEWWERLDEMKEYYGWEDQISLIIKEK